MKFTKLLTIDEEAICCQGHFPGNPLVPGAYLLSLVAQAVNRWLPEYRLQSLSKVKFVAALIPGVHANMELETKDDTTVLFRITRDNQTIVSGKGLLCPRVQFTE